jgi:hypothetical protein
MSGAPKVDPMSTIPKCATPRRDTPAPVARDHEHVGRISTQTTIFALIAVAPILYEIQWILPPFVIAGVIAYLTTPAIDWASARSRLPRLIFVLLAFSLFLLFVTLICYLGIPPLAREMTHVFNDFEAVVRELAQRMIGSGKISMLGQPMDAGQLATTVGNGLRSWFAQTSVIATLGAAIFATMFGLILTLVLSESRRNFLTASPFLGWGVRTATWKPASNTFTAGTLGNSRGWKRWSPRWTTACGCATG